MFLLDTNVLAELRRAKTGRAEPSVVAWARSVPPEGLFISVLTVLEIEIGILRVERRDAAQGSILRRWLDEQVLPAFAERLLPIDAPVVRRCAPLHVPDPRPERDALLAATALVHGLTVVTRNSRDFAGAGVALLDPWDEHEHE